MSILELSLLLACTFVAVGQCVLCLKLVAAFRREAPPEPSDEDFPPVLAVLCLRGTDPFLPRSLRRLFTQDYPNYLVRVVIDSPTDPVRRVVEDVCREVEATHVEIITLAHHDQFCSAKMSSLLLATNNLPDDTQVVATFDGDCVLHPTCLRELVTPLVREDVAVTTGNRWFAPPKTTLGAVARLQWNLACVPLMHQMGLPWGGCLAMQRSVIEDGPLRTLYSRAFAEDMLLGSVMRRRGQTIRFVPQATIVNREDVSLSGLLNFLTRQMLCVRLHHHRWERIVGWGVLVTTLAGIVCPLALLIPELRMTGAIGLAMLMASSILPMILMGISARKVVAERGERLVRWTGQLVLMMLLAAPLTQLVTLAANLRAVFTRRISWRGLTYQFARNPQVRLIHETPVEELGQEYQIFHRELPQDTHDHPYEPAAEPTVML